MTFSVISRPRMIAGLCVARIAALATLSLFISQAILHGHAETVEYAGRAFKVDSLRDIDGGSVALEVNGQELLTSKSTLGRSLFALYAQQPELLERQGVFSGYGSWVATLPSRGDEAGAVTAVERVLGSPQIDVVGKLGFYAEVVSTKDGERVLSTAVSSLGGGDVGVCGALGFLSSESQLLLKDAQSIDREWITMTCPRSLVELARQLMVGGKTGWGIDMLRAATMFSRSSEIGEAASTSLQRIEMLDKARNSQDPAQLTSALDVTSFDALLREYFEKIRPEVIDDFSARALRDGKPMTALRALSLLDFSLRNDAQHELVSQALHQLHFEDREIVRDPGVRALVWSYATRDDDIRQRYMATLEDWINRCLDEDNPGQALSLLQNLTELRLDPSPANDTLRGAIAEHFVDNGDDEAANRVLRDIRTELPWVYRFRLLLKRDMYVLIMVSLGYVVVVRWAFMLINLIRRRNTARRIAQEAERRAAEVAQREWYHSQFADDALRAEGFLDIDEYAAGLKKFNLTPGASLKEIKNAFRHVVKTLHPDLNPRASEDDTRVFIDLTRTYERLLVLHAERERRATSSK